MGLSIVTNKFYFQSSLPELPLEIELYDEDESNHGM